MNMECVYCLLFIVFIHMCFQFNVPRDTSLGTTRQDVRAKPRRATQQTCGKRKHRRVSALLFLLSLRSWIMLGRTFTGSPAGGVRVGGAVGGVVSALARSASSLASKPAAIALCTSGRCNHMTQSTLANLLAHTQSVFFCAVAPHHHVFSQSPIDSLRR
jgi:hypothetical protein